MSAAAFFTDEAKKRVTAAIQDVESKTSAEVVVVVQRVSGRYRYADLSAGAVAGFAMLLVVLFHPKEVPLVAIPIDVLLAFVAGAVLTAYLDPLRRLLAGTRRMEEEVGKAARAAFVERGISRTRGRSGILVFVSTFERRIEVVRDVGVDPREGKDAWARAVSKLTGSVHEGADFDAFVDGLKELGPALSKDLPRSEDDVNELPDEPVTS